MRATNTQLKAQMKARMKAQMKAWLWNPVHTHRIGSRMESMWLSENTANRISTQQEVEKWPDLVSEIVDVEVV